MKNKPKFKRQDSILKKLKNSWRRPRGLHSKLRLKKRGKGKRPKIGYGNDKKTKGLIKNKKSYYVNNLGDLDNAKNSIIISSVIGLKKKIEIINKAKELKLDILNIKEIDNFLDNIKKMREEKIKEKNKKKEEKKSIEKTKKEETKEEKERKIKEEKKKVLEKGI